MEDATVAQVKTEDATQQQAATSTVRRTIVVLPPPPRAPELSDQANVAAQTDKKLYWDRSHYESPASQIRALHNSSTLYVGNLAFTTRTQHVRAHFGLLGPVCKIFMGLDRLKKTPCGFCFVEYEQRKHALLAVANLSGTKLDGSIIRVELDAGFQPGRQYGRGRRGGQVRHDNNRNKNQEDSRKRQRIQWTPPPPAPAAAAAAAAAADGGGADAAADGTTAGPTEGGDGQEQQTQQEDDDEGMGGGEPSAKRQRTG